MEKSEGKKTIEKKIVGIFNKKDLALMLLKMAPFVTDWGLIKISALTQGKRATIDRVKELQEENKERPNAKKRGRKSDRPGKYTAEEWKKLKNRERAARYRDRQKQKLKGTP